MPARVWAILFCRIHEDVMDGMADVSGGGASLSVYFLQLPARNAQCLLKYETCNRCQLIIDVIARCIQNVQ